MPKANIISNEKKLKIFSKIENNTRIPTSLLLFKVVLEVLTRAVKQVKEMKASKL
jgi:hypothetical protein